MLRGGLISACLVSTFIEPNKPMTSLAWEKAYKSELRKPPRGAAGISGAKREVMLRIDRHK